MKAAFWHERWKKNQIGFHEGKVNRMLKAFHDRLPEGGRVFVPLCGKTRDIAWLRDKGHDIAGAELSERAVQQLFDEMGETPETEEIGRLKRFAIEGIEIFAGDIFDLDAGTLGPVDAVFDRAAVMALPENARGHYAAHVAAITGHAPQLLVTFEYDPAEMDGPPFSLTRTEIADLYAADFNITLLADKAVPGKLKGICESREKAWFLMPIHAVSR